MPDEVAVEQFLAVVGRDDDERIVVQSRRGQRASESTEKLGVEPANLRIVERLDPGPVARGEIGVLLAKGESNAKYYWDNPEKTAATMLGEWLNTGDMYYQDEDGYFVNCGRGDDMLKVGALWCSPFEIEATLIEHSKVLEAAVVGRADDDELIKPEAFVVLNDAADAGQDLAEDLRAHCRDKLARYKYPRWFNFVEELPKTATGKIQRFRLRAAG